MKSLVEKSTAVTAVMEETLTKEMEETVETAEMDLVETVLTAVPKKERRNRKKDAA